MSEYYIASCVFTPKFPEISAKIQKYIRERYGMTIVRCCVPNYKLDEIAQRVPEKHRPDWLALPDCADFKAGDTVYSLCHNCSNIIEETKPVLKFLRFGSLYFPMINLFIPITAE